MKTDSGIIKENVLNQICAGRGWSKSGRAKYRINKFNKSLIHMRYCSPDKNNSPHYKFNINHSTLSADFEVWICGSPDIYYLIPIQVIKQIYKDPDTYVDSYHLEIRVVSVNIDTDSVTYARGGKSINISQYLRGTL
jgi:hypothetical protein